MTRLWTVTKCFTFDAAHKLTEHDGKCCILHGHTYKLEITVSGCELAESGSKQGMLIDFGEIKKAVEPLIDTYLDHCFLNDLSVYPTAENLAQWIWKCLAPKLPNLCEVVLWETPDSRVSYSEYASELWVGMPSGLKPVPIGP